MQTPCLATFPSVAEVWKWREDCGVFTRNMAFVLVLLQLFCPSTVMSCA
uniref:Uncharacterized protein n=1 Tax=Anguilla anguilla TaxID=7936 RepID=A0A0E9U185_ANGAN